MVWLVIRYCYTWSPVRKLNGSPLFNKLLFTNFYMFLMINVIYSSSLVEGGMSAIKPDGSAVNSTVSILSDDFPWKQ